MVNKKWCEMWCMVYTTSELCKTGCSKQLQGAVVLLLEEICANEMQWLPNATCRTLDNNLDHNDRDSQTSRLHWQTKLGYHTLNLSSLIIITTTLQTPNFVNAVCYALCSSGMWCSSRPRRKVINQLPSCIA